jgi:sugar (pentulose or hexulose) kinase
MFLGLDLGTGSLKALLIDAVGRVLQEVSVPYAVTARYPGWAESDPEDWWRAAVTATRAVVGTQTHEIRAIGLSGQMHSLVLCDAAGQPARNAILWADTRSGSQLEGYGKLQPALRQRLGNPTVTGMTGPSLLWVRQNDPASYDAATWALQPKDWLRLRLTGEALTDPSDASATLLYDLTRDAWDAEVISALGLRTDCLPEIQPAHSVGGSLTRVAAEALGLKAGIPVAVGAGDTAAAMLGGGLLQPGIVQLTVGSGAQIVAPCSALSIDPEFRTHLFRSCLPVPWYRMAAMQNAGLALTELPAAPDGGALAAQQSKPQRGLGWIAAPSQSRPPDARRFRGRGLRHPRRTRGATSRRGAARRIAPGRGGHDRSALAATPVRHAAMPLAGGRTPQCLGSRGGPAGCAGGGCDGLDRPRAAGDPDYLGG